MRRQFRVADPSNAINRVSEHLRLVSPACPTVNRYLIADGPRSLPRRHLYTRDLWSSERSENGATLADLGCPPDDAHFGDATPKAPRQCRRTVPETSWCATATSPQFSGPLSPTACSFGPLKQIVSTTASDSRAYPLSSTACPPPLFSDFLNDAAAGNLPAVSFVDPTYTILDDGTGNDDHPHADIRNGDAFLVNIYQALSSSPAWSNTVLIITFDEWGGFFEHVAPPRVPAPNGLDTDQVNGQVLLGFRVPVIIVSPFTQNTGPSPLVNHTVFDHTSILKLIEWRWNLQPLTARDASPLIGNPATAMNFSAPVYAVPNLPVPQSVFAWPCFEGGIFQSSATSGLRPGTTHNPPATEWGRLSQTEHVRRWLERPKFRRSHGENVTPR